MQPRRSAKSKNGLITFIACAETGAMFTAVITGSPFSAATMPSATSIETPIWASTVDAPRCGVSVMPGTPRSGLSSASGSDVNTSMAAPATCPLFTASARSCSLMMPPRAQFTKRTPFFIFAMLSLLNISRVSFVSGI